VNHRTDVTEQPESSGVFREAVVLVALGFVFWFLLAGPAWLVGGAVALGGLTVAAGLCLAPACVSAAARVWLNVSPLASFLVSSGLRLACVAGAALLAKFTRPELGVREFFGWLILFYLFVLVVESLQALHRMGQLKKWFRRS